MATIYISSTYSDLQEYREAVYHALRQLRHDVIAMEDYVATDQRPLAKCLVDVASCDIYVGIFAWRYGYIPSEDNPEHKSITELEYRKAGAEGKARLIFLLHKDTPWPPPLMDSQTNEGDEGERIRALRDELALDRLLSFFKNPDELARLVNTAVSQWERAQVNPSQSDSLAVFNAPPLPPNFIERPEDLEKLRRAVLTSSPNRQIALTAVQGMGGIGKSVLALALCMDAEVQKVFPDGIIWVTIGREPNLATQITEVGKALRDPPERYDTLEASVNRLRTILRGKRILFVLDDVWQSSHAELFWVNAPQCRTILTTRNRSVALSLGAEIVSLETLTPEQSVALLREWAKRDDPDMAAVAARLGHLPLALKLAGARLQEGMSGGEWLQMFRHVSQMKLSRLSDDPKENLQLCFDLSVEQLLDKERQLYYALGIFPELTRIPHSAVIRLLQRLHTNLDQFACNELITDFARRALIEFDPKSRTLTLHPLLHDYTREKLGAHLQATHAELLMAYNPNSRPWSEIEHDEYLYVHLAYHLDAAEQTENLRSLLCNYDWLQAKLDATDVNALIADYDMFPNDSDLHHIQDAIRLSAHIIGSHKGELRSQIYGRLMAHAGAAIRKLVEQIRNETTDTWLRLLTPSILQAGGALLRTLIEDMGPVNTIAITPNGSTSVSGSTDGIVRVWNLAQGKLVLKLEGHTGWVQGVAIAADELRVVSGGIDGTIRVWDLTQGAATVILEGHPGGIRGVAVAADGLRAVSGGVDGTIRVWDLTQGKATRSLMGHAEGVRGIIVTPDWRRVVAGGDDGTVRVWDLGSGELVRTLEGHTGGVQAITVTADGELVISGGDDGTVRVWDLGSGGLVQTLAGYTGSVQAIAVTTDGQQVISGGVDGTIRVWDLARGELMRTLEGHTGGVQTVAVTVNGRQVVSGGFDGTVRVWDLLRGELMQAQEKHTGGVQGVAITVDGLLAVSGGADGIVRVWDLGRGEILQTLKGDAKGVQTVTMTADRERAISGGKDGTVRVWDLTHGELIQTLKGHSDWVRGVSVTADGQQVVSGGDDRTIRVWNLSQDKLVLTLEGDTEGIRAVAVTADGRQAVSGGGDGTVRVWDLVQGELVLTLDDHMDVVQTVAVTADGRRAISGSEDRTVRMWDLAHGVLELTLEGHTGVVQTVAMTAEGRYAVSGADDRTLHVWDLEQGELITSFSGESPFTSCAVTPDGLTIVAGEQSGRVHFLRLEEASP